MKRMDKLIIAFLYVYMFIFFFIMALSNNSVIYAILWALFAVIVFQGMQYLEKKVIGKEVK